MMKVIVSGGGTGGHVFPAIAIANALKTMHTNIDILFVGALGKLEMDKVPKAGYPIKGLWISGFDRKFTLKNLLFPFKLIYSLIKAFFIVLKFKPDVAVGVGGYASGPTLKVAEWLGVPTVLQEANSFPGVTNRLLGAGAKKVCVAYDEMDKYFAKDKLVITGNPIRSNIIELKISKEEAAKEFGLSTDLPTIFITGGSLGARAINNAIAAQYDEILASNVQVIWQTGKLYIEEFKSFSEGYENRIVVTDFISRMDAAYQLADLVISRAGGTIAELAIVGKPAILLPSPNVTEDHQTKNVLALVKREAAILIKDREANKTLVPTALSLLLDENQKQRLSTNIRQLAKPNAAEHIANIVTEVAKYKK